MARAFAPRRLRRSLRRVLWAVGHAVLAVVGLPLAWAAERLLRRSSSRVGVALVYHSVDRATGDLERELVPAHGVGLFAKEVRHLRRRYRVVPSDRLLESVAERQRGDPFPVAITFDDDLPCHTELVLPVLLREHATATFFLTGTSLERPFAFWWERLQRVVDAGGAPPALPVEVAGSPGEPFWIHELGRQVLRLTAEERDRFADRLAEQAGPDPPGSGLRTAGVRALAAAGMTIGFHTRRHDPLAWLDDAALARALRTGREELEQIVETPLDVIAYPHGHFDDRVVEATRDAGFAFAFTTRPRPVRPESDPVALGRIIPSYRSTGHFALQLVWALSRRLTSSERARGARLRCARPEERGPVSER